MPRPNRDRQSVTLYISRSGLTAIDQIATEHGLTRSDVMRLALKHGLPAVTRDLAKAKPAGQ